MIGISDSCLRSAPFRVRDEPLQSYVDVIFFFTRNRVAAYLAILNGAQVHFLNQLFLVQGSREVTFIAENQDRNAGQLRLVQKVLQFISRRLELFVVGGVHHVDDAIHATTVPFPHGPEARLAADVPQFDGHVAFGDLTHVESDRWNHVLAKLARGDDVDECRLAGILEADQGEFHFLFPKEAFKPVEDAGKEGKHDDRVSGVAI